MVIRVRGIEIDNKRRTISFNGAVSRHLPRRQWQIALCLLLGGGMTADEMFDICYYQRADGGPLGGSESVRIAVHKHHTKNMLKTLGLKLVTSRHGENNTRYEAIPTEDARGCR